MLSRTYHIIAAWFVILAGCFAPWAARASGEFKATDAPNKTLYTILLNAASQLYRKDTTVFETLADANWTTTKYVIALSEMGGSQLYTGNMPITGTAAGRYSFIVFEQAGVAPAETDSIIAQGSLDWSGSGVASIGTHTGTDGKTLLSANVQTGVTIPTVTAVTNDINAAGVRNVSGALLVAPNNWNLAAINGSGFGSIAAIAAGTTAPAGFFASASAPALAWFANLGYADPWSVALPGSYATGTAGNKLGNGMQAGNVTVGGYATNQDPAYLLLNSTLLSSVTGWATGSLGYYWERTIGSDWGGYTRSPTTGVITFTMPNGQTFTATISVNASGQITGRVTN